MQEATAHFVIFSHSIFVSQPMSRAVLLRRGPPRRVYNKGNRHDRIRVWYVKLAQCTSSYIEGGFPPAKECDAEKKDCAGLFRRLQALRSPQWVIHAVEAAELCEHTSASKPNTLATETGIEPVHLWIPGTLKRRFTAPVLSRHFTVLFHTAPLCRRGYSHDVGV